MNDAKDPKKVRSPNLMKGPLQEKAFKSENRLSLDLDHWKLQRYLLKKGQCLTLPPTVTDNIDLRKS